MPRRVHAFVQHAHELDQAGTCRAIENDMNRAAYPRPRRLGARMPQVQAPHAVSKLRPIAGGCAERLRRRLAQRRRHGCTIPLPSFGAPGRVADPQDARQVDLREAGEAIPQRGAAPLSAASPLR